MACEAVEQYIGGILLKQLAEYGVDEPFAKRMVETVRSQINS